VCFWACLHILSFDFPGGNVSLGSIVLGLVVVIFNISRYDFSVVEGDQVAGMT
jgi:hypothetical protein